MAPLCAGLAASLPLLASRQSSPSGAFVASQPRRLPGAVSASCVLACGLVARSAYRGGEKRGHWRGHGSQQGVVERRRSRIDPDELARATEAKRSRESARFFTFQRRVKRTGVQRDETFWRREEAQLFEADHVRAGKDFDKYQDLPVQRGGGACEGPVESFLELCERFEPPPELQANLRRCGYNTPTPVQRHSMPAACGGADVLVSAQTGSGKTAAFLLPILSSLLRLGDRPIRIGPVLPAAVVLAPTRELCKQIAVEARRLCFRSQCRIVSLVGGDDAITQLDALAEGCELAVCTPGRLDDFLRRGVVGLGQVRQLVLDEADRMLDMGFEPQIRSLVERMPPAAERQTMMFSATLPPTIHALASEFLRPDHFSLKVASLSSVVEQRFVDVTSADKLCALLSVLSEVQGKTIIFANQRSTVSDLTGRLVAQSVRAREIHGGLLQYHRQKALDDLRKGRADVLVATDVAARGLDLPGVDHIINYELSLSADDHVHRIGRTGRIGNAGVAISFVGTEEPALRAIVAPLRRRGRPLPDWLVQLATKPRSKVKAPAAPQVDQEDQENKKGQGYGDDEERVDNEEVGNDEGGAVATMAVTR